MEISNYNVQIANVAVNQNNATMKTRSVAQTDNYINSEHLLNSDTFVKCYFTDEDAGTYSLNDITATSQKNKIQTSKTTAVQANTTSDPTVCLDTIKRAAAKKAGISLSPSGSPSINGGTESRLYFGEISRINNCFYCQTGGWSALSGDGSNACGRTAAATMVSINSGTTVTPNNTYGSGDNLGGITVNNTSYNLKTNNSTYNVNSGAANGLNYYECGSESGVIAAINNELEAGRSVMVKTTVAGQHWVTVTGTIDGKYAESFDDFVGVDPWYNGNNAGNPSTGTGNGATNSNRAGVIQLSDVTNQNLHSDYAIITFKS